MRMAVGAGGFGAMVPAPKGAGFGLKQDTCKFLFRRNVPEKTGFRPKSACVFGRNLVFCSKSRKKGQKQNKAMEQKFIGREQ